MLATRSLRLAATRYYSPAVYAWSVQTKTPLKLQQTTTWYTAPIAAAYSKDTKSGVFNSSFIFITQKRFNASIPAPKLTTESCTLPTMALKTSPLTATNETAASDSSPLTAANETAASKSSDQTIKSSTSSNTPIPSSSSNSSFTQCDKSTTDKESSYTGPLNEAGVKLPNREQMERFLFKSLVYIWDFAFYAFVISRKFFETYVWNNPTVQYYWKTLLKRMEDARKEIQSK